MRSYVALTLAVLGGSAIAERAPVPMPPPPHRVGPRPPPPPPQPPRIPHASAEVAQLAKDFVGTYKCKGVMLNNDGSSTPIVGTFEAKLDLDGTWLASSFSEQRAQPGLKFSDFRTYDPTAKQWTRIHLDNAMSYVEETSLGAQNGAWTWTGSATTSSGSFDVRDHEQLDGKQLKLWGESMLSGKWQKLYEMTCAR